MVVMTTRMALLTLSAASFLFSQPPAAVEKDIPAVVTFVAPAYPRAAKDLRIMAKTRTRVTVNRAGIVTEVKTIVAYPLFEQYVLDALQRWRFQASDREHTFEVICLFELDQECDAAHWRPITPETYVSADLPTRVYIRSEISCPAPDINYRKR